MTTGLEQTLKALWRDHRPDAGEVVPIAIEREPARTEAGTEKETIDQKLTSSVPTVPTVPGISEKTHARTASERFEADAAEWQERAAVLEFSGGLSREAAERKASEELGYRLPVPGGSPQRRRPRF